MECVSEEGVKGRETGREGGLGEGGGGIEGEGRKGWDGLRGKEGRRRRSRGVMVQGVQRKGKGKGKRRR